MFDFELIATISGSLLRFHKLLHGLVEITSEELILHNALLLKFALRMSLRVQVEDRPQIDMRLSRAGLHFDGEIREGIDRCFRIICFGPYEIILKQFGRLRNVVPLLNALHVLQDAFTADRVKYLHFQSLIFRTVLNDR